MGSSHGPALREPTLKIERNKKPGASVGMTELKASGRCAALSGNGVREQGGPFCSFNA
jgi:hypothetical protein